MALPSVHACLTPSQSYAFLHLLCICFASASVSSAQCYEFRAGTRVLSVNVTQTPVPTVNRTDFSDDATYLLSPGSGNTITLTTSEGAIAGGGSIRIITAKLSQASPGSTWVWIAAYSSEAKLYFGVALQTSKGIIVPATPLPATMPTLDKWEVDAYLSTSVEFLGPQTRYALTAIGSCGSGGTPPPPAVDADKSAGNQEDCPGACIVGDPINLGTGSLFERVIDFETAGASRLRFVRYYNSVATKADVSSLGKNWRSTFDRQIRVLSPTSVRAERENGRVILFTLAAGSWASDRDVDIRLTKSGSTWSLVDQYDTVEVYNSITETQAILASIRFRNGYTQTVQYGPQGQIDSVTDSFSRSLRFTYQNGLLHTITTPENLVLTYSYTSSGQASGTSDRLAAVGYSTSPPTRQSYLYENGGFPFALTGTTDENGNRHSSWTYDSSGRATSSQHTGGVDLIRISYNDTDGSRTVTNALGQQTVYKFTTLQGVPKIAEINMLASSTISAATQRFTYDSNGYTASRTDWKGTTTAYVNDALGQPTRITEASGTPQQRTTAISYHSTFHLPVEIVEPGLTTKFTYDSSGNLLTRTETDTTSGTVPYATRNSSRMWTYTWANGLLTSVKGPRTDVSETTKFTYDSSGTLTEVENALGHKLRVTKHTPGGYPQTIVDANGVQVDLAYDARMRLLSRTLVTASKSFATRYSYDPAGNLLTTTLSDGAALTNTRDAAYRVTGVTDLLQQTVGYSLDALGNPMRISVADANARVQRVRTATFDALGRQSTDVGAANQTTRFTYDANGNPLTITDPRSGVTRQEFDALNRRARITDPAGGITLITYDEHDRPLTVTDPNGGVTRYTYDGFGNLIQRISPDTGTTIYRYDVAGNLTQKVDATGATANYSYDALGRIIATRYPGNGAEDVTYTYDETGYGFSVGRLTTVRDPAGTLHRHYDERGNVLKETRSR